VTNVSVCAFVRCYRRNVSKRLSGQLVHEVDTAQTLVRVNACSPLLTASAAWSVKVRE